MTHKLARTRLNAARLNALPPGSHVIDADMDVSVKREDGLWEGYEMGPITTAKLLKYGPIKQWFHGHRTPRPVKVNA